jgi:hypothetical protein
MRPYPRSSQYTVAVDEAAEAPKCSVRLGVTPLAILVAFAALYALMAAVLLSVTRL